jgi:dipeptidyl aminopeptidase/acylaminoacyl peptidase
MLKLLAGAAMAALIGAAAAVPAAIAGTPIEAYGRLPGIQNVEISPDGKALALIATIGADEPRIIVRDIAEGQVLANTALSFRKVRGLMWADADHVIITASSTSGVDDTLLVGEMFQMLSLNVRTGAFVQLPLKGMDSMLNIQVGAIQPGLPDNGRAVVFTPLIVTVKGNMQHDGAHRDLFKIELDTGQARRHQMGDSNTYAYLVKPDGTVLAKASYQERQSRDDAVWTLALRKGSSWQDVVAVAGAVDAPDLWGLSIDGKSVILDTWDPKEKLWRPTPVSLSDGKLGDFIGPPRPQGGVVNADGVVMGYTHMDGFVEYDFLEPRLKAIWPAFRAAFKGQQVKLQSWTPDFQKLILFVEGGATSGGYYLADTTMKRVDPIGVAYPKVDPRDIGPVRVIHYLAADGLKIEGYLALPPGKPEKDLPLVVLPHGGPRAHDDAGFDWWAQALVSRGYAVLKPNFRGSTGYGHDFMTAGYGEWGGKMQTDLSDGVAYLAKQGVIDPKRVCIAGASYGGYAALAGVTLQKDIYRCAVSVSGVSDLSKLMQDDILRSGEQSTIVRDEKRLFAVERPSDPKLSARSPANNGALASAPILLIHGKDDTVVPFAHSRKMAASLKAADKPHEFVVLKNEDHWMSNSATRLEMLAATVAFIEKNNPPD